MILPYLTVAVDGTAAVDLNVLAPLDLECDGLLEIIVKVAGVI